jgi:hypothetical protein
VIAARLGHANAAFTLSTYAHSQDEVLQAAAMSFGRLVTLLPTGGRGGPGFRCWRRCASWRGYMFCAQMRELIR